MAKTAPVVKLDRITLTQEHLRALEIVLYQFADMRDRILASGVPYTKLEEVPNA